MATAAVNEPGANDDLGAPSRNSEDDAEKTPEAAPPGQKITVDSKDGHTTAAGSAGTSDSDGEKTQSNLQRPAVATTPHLQKDVPT